MSGVKWMIAKINCGDAELELKEKVSRVAVCWCAGDAFTDSFM